MRSPAFCPFDPWTTRMQPSPSWSSLPVHRAGTPIRRWILPPLVALYQRLQHLESAGGPLKPGFGLSGDVQIHRLSPPNRLDCPHAMGTDAFTAGGIISSLSPVTTVGMAKWKVGGRASHESSRWMEYRRLKPCSYGGALRALKRRSSTVVQWSVRAHRKIKVKSSGQACPSHIIKSNVNCIPWPVFGLVP